MEVNPVLIEITKSRISAREKGKASFFEGEAYIGEATDPRTKKIVPAVDSSPTSRKLFYNNPRILIDDYKITAEALRYLITVTRKSTGAGSLVKPIIIANVSGDVSSVEIRALVEALNEAGAREVIVMNEPEMPSDQLFSHDHKLPGKVVYGNDRYAKGEKIVFLIMAFAFLIISTYLWRIFVHGSLK